MYSDYNTRSSIFSCKWSLVVLMLTHAHCYKFRRITFIFLSIVFVVRSPLPFYKTLLEFKQYFFLAVATRLQQKLLHFSSVCCNYTKLSWPWNPPSLSKNHLAARMSVSSNLGQATQARGKNMAQLPSWAIFFHEFPQTWKVPSQNHQWSHQRRLYYGEMLAHSLTLEKVRRSQYSKREWCSKSQTETAHAPSFKHMPQAAHV